MLSNYHKALLAMQDLSYGELEKLERDIAETKHGMDMVTQMLTKSGVRVLSMNLKPFMAAKIIT